MKILIVEPGKHPREAEIDGSLKSMQNIVGGRIEPFYPYGDPVALVCNDEGKMNGLPLNRAVRDVNGEIYEIMAGTFFVCGLGDDSFESLTTQQMETYRNKFHHPEAFAHIGGKVVVIPADEIADTPHITHSGIDDFDGR